MLRRRPRRPFHKVLPAGRGLLLPGTCCVISDRFSGNPREGRRSADQVQGRLDMCLEQIEMLHTELVGTVPDDPHAGGGVTMTHARKLCARGSERRRFDSVRGHGVTRGVDIEERSGGEKRVDIKPLKYHCRAKLMARGGKTMEPLRLQAVPDSASGVTSISERLLERLRKQFGGVDVSPLKSGPCQV